MHAHEQIHEFLTSHGLSDLKRFLTRPHAEERTEEEDGSNEEEEEDLDCSSELLQETLDGVRSAQKTPKLSQHGCESSDSSEQGDDGVDDASVDTNSSGPGDSVKWLRSKHIELTKVCMHARTHVSRQANL